MRAIGMAMLRIYYYPVRGVFQDLPCAFSQGFL